MRCVTCSRRPAVLEACDTLLAPIYLWHCCRSKQLCHRQTTVNSVPNALSTAGPGCKPAVVYGPLQLARVQKLACSLAQILQA